MKKILFVLSATALMFASCSVLNSDPETEFTRTNYFTSEQNVEVFANYFYNTFTGYGSGSGDYYFNYLNDDQSNRGLTPWLYTNPSATSSLWNSCYEEIRRANTLIEAIPGIESMTDDAKNNWLGVARLYRAWQHYKLVRSFGDCYYVDKVLNTNDEILKGARTDRDEVMYKVLDDLNFAVENITYNEGSRTAFNKYVANAMKAEICLYEGTFCKYRSAADHQKAADASRASFFLEECVTACEVITEATDKFDLNGTDVEGYHANFNSFDLNGNKEMILYKHYVLGVMAHGTIDYTCGSTPVIGMSKDAFDSYLFRDGKTKAETALNTSDHGVVVNIKAADGHCDTDHDVIDISALLAVRDPRLSCQVDNIVHFVDHGYARFGGAESTSTTGYGVYLFDVTTIGTTEPNWNNTNRQSTNGNWTDAPIFWLGNILLNYAEACAELGYNAKATIAINRLRTRVGMPGVEVTGGNMIDNVRRERRCEMMYCMNDRYWSLIRWHQLDKLDTDNNPDIAKGAWVGALAGTSVDVDANGYIVTLNGNKRQYGADGWKHYLNPIPTNEISLNAAIGQNPGW